MQLYCKGVGVWNDFDRDLQFVVGLHACRLDEWSPNASVELELATAKLYMDRPLGAESDRAHNVELALSYAVPAMQQLDRGVGADARIRLHELLRQIYATRFKQDSAETLERARHHFNEALKA